MRQTRARLCVELGFSSLVLVCGIFLLWELVLAVWFHEAGPGVLRALHLARGVSTAFILAAWAAALVWRARSHYEGERQVLRQAMAWSEHLTALGRMAAAYAHHLHSPLAAALVRVQRLRSGDREPDPDRRRVARERDVDSLERSLRSCQRSIRRVLDFVEPASGALSGTTSLGEALEAAAMLLRPEMDAHRVALELDIAAAVGVQLAVPGHRLEAVLVDLVRNAMEAQPGGGSVQLLAEAPDQGFATIFVRDRGPGFSADALKRAGEPFYSTKPLGPSLGMGLPLVRKFIEDAGGKLSIRNLEGAGAEVALRVPIVQEAAPCPTRS